MTFIELKLKSCHSFPYILKEEKKKAEEKNRFFFCDPLKSFPWENQVTSVSGEQILNNPWVWYSQNIPPMIKMLNLNMTQHRTQATGLGVMISRYSPDNLHGRPDHHPMNVCCSFFRYTNDDLRNYTNQRHKHKTWTKEDKQLALHCYFRSNLTQRRYRKRMIEIWQECANFQTTSQRLAD